MIRSATPDDAARIAEIYNFYIANSIATFEEEPVSEDEMVARIGTVTEEFPWFVFEEAGRILGYAYAGRWKTRAAYRYSVEVTVYLDPVTTGRGVGTRLYESLLGSLRNGEYHTIMGGISLPNAGSIRLHERFGFRKVAHFSEVGFKFGKWIDVGYWQLNLEGKEEE